MKDTSGKKTFDATNYDVSKQEVGVEIQRQKDIFEEYIKRKQAIEENSKKVFVAFEELKKKNARDQRVTKEKFEAISKIPEIVEAYLNNKEIQEKVKQVDMEFGNLQNETSKCKAKLDEEIKMASESSGESGYNAYLNAKETLQRYNGILQKNNNELGKHTQSTLSLIQKEGSDQQNMIERLKNQMEDLEKLLEAIGGSKAKKITEDDRKIEEENKRQPKPINPADRCIILVNPPQNELILYKAGSKGNDKDKLEIVHVVSTIPKYSHALKVGDNIYINGGIGDDSNVITDNGVIETLKDLTYIQKLASMTVAKAYHTQVELSDNEIVSIGGVDNKYTIDDCEKYSIKENVWEKMPSLQEKKKYVSATVWTGRDSKAIYVFGGVIGKECVNSIECLKVFPTLASEWDYIEISTTTYPESYCSGVFATKDSILLFGGSGNVEKNIYKFDILKRSITLCHNKLPVPGSFRNTSYIVEGDILGLIGLSKTLFMLDLQNCFTKYIPLIQEQIPSGVTVYVSTKKEEKVITTHSAIPKKPEEKALKPPAQQNIKTGGKPNTTTKRFDF